MGSIVAEIADKIASAGGGERSELEIRGGTGAEGGGILTLSTSELTVVDGDKLGRIDFRARAETGADALLVSASIWAEADDVFDASGNETEIVFAVGTAGTAVAAEVVRIDHDGQLGIGVATPASLLHVAGTVQVGVDDTGHDVIFYGDAAGALAMWDTSENALFVRGASADAVGSSGRIVLQTNQPAVADGDIIGRIDWNAPAEHATDGNEVAASIWAEADDTFAADNNSAELVFATGASEIAVEKMRLTHDGELGIGVATPASLLHVAGTVQVGVDDTGHDVKFFGASAGAFMLYDESADTLQVMGPSADATTSTGKLLLTTSLTDINDGDILGRIDFGAPLEATGTDAILPGAAIWAEADATFTATSNNTELVFATNDSAAASEKMRIAADGNVGIGTTAPGNKLTVKGDTIEINQIGTSAYARFLAIGGEAKAAWIYFLSDEGDDNADNWVQNNVTGTNAADAHMYFADYGQGSWDNQMVILNNGNVGCDGTFQAGGVDYAEFFEWKEDLADEAEVKSLYGMTVVLDGNKVRIATTGEEDDVLGVVRPNGTSSIIGGGATMRWEGKYSKDVWGETIQEEYTQCKWFEYDADGNEYIDYIGS